MTVTTDEPGRAPGEAWRRYLAYLAEESDWPCPALLQVGVAAVAHPKLSRLFPFQAMASFCFSRTAWPYTNDCPCITVVRDGDRWMVSASPYEPGARTRLLDTDRLEDAVACVADNLPPGLQAP